MHLPFRYPWGVRDCLVCTKTVSVTTFPTTMANVRLTMNATVRTRLRKPQQHTEQSGAKDWAEPGSAPEAEPLRLNGDSVAGRRIVEPLIFECSAAMAPRGLMLYWGRQVGELTGARQRRGIQPVGHWEGQQKTNSVKQNNCSKPRLWRNDVQLPQPVPITLKKYWTTTEFYSRKKSDQSTLKQLFFHIFINQSWIWFEKKKEEKVTIAHCFGTTSNKVQTFK